MPRTLRHGIASLAGCVLMVAGAQFAAPAKAAEPEHDPTPAAPTVIPAPDPLADVDTDAVADAAADFTPGSASDAATLAEAASTVETVPVAKVGGGMVAETDAGSVEVAKSGEATISAEGMPEIGISVEGDPSAVEIVDGAVVQTDVAPPPMS